MTRKIESILQSAVAWCFYQFRKKRTKYKFHSVLFFTSILIMHSLRIVSSWKLLFYRVFQLFELLFIGCKINTKVIHSFYLQIPFDTSLLLSFVVSTRNEQLNVVYSWVFLTFFFCGQLPHTIFVNKPNDTYKEHQWMKPQAQIIS